MTEQPKPFDLEAAKNGAEILFDGEPCKFIAHIPENLPEWRVAVAKEGKLVIFTEDGREWADEEPRLTMAPRKEKTGGYRDCYFRRGERLTKYTAYEGNFITPKSIECSEGFIRWIHTEWQYDEVEIP